jgi:hypothetical protein
VGQIGNRTVRAVVLVGALIAGVAVSHGVAGAVGEPTIVRVESSDTGSKSTGDTVTISVVFSEQVTVTGWTTLTLETGQTDRTVFCSNCSGNPTNMTNMNFSYKVQIGDRSTDLDYQSASALLLNGATIVKTGTALPAIVTLPTPGSANSLAGQAAISVSGEGEGEQWQSPFSSSEGLHGMTLYEDHRENVSQLWKLNAGAWSVCAFQISHAELTSNVATIDTGSTRHGFSVSDSITISGMNSPFDALNGTHVVTAVSSRTMGAAESIRNSISFAKTNANITSAVVSSGQVARDCSASTLWYRSVLPVCADASSTDCIERFSATQNGGSEVVGTFDRKFPLRGQNDFASDITGIPSGSTTSLFNLAGLTHGGSDTKYAVTASIVGTRSVDGSLGARSVFVSVTPTSIKMSTGCSVVNNGQCMDDANGSVAVDQDGGYRCILWDSLESASDGDNVITGADSSTCALKHGFPTNVKMKVQLRLSSSPGGWIHGRIADPLVTFETSGSNTIATFEAAPMEVPTVGAAAPYEGLPAAVKSWFDANCSVAETAKCGTRFYGQNWATSATRNAVMSPASYSPDAFSQLELWNDFIEDRAGATPSHWYLRTLSSTEMTAASSCISGVTGVAGVVSTNATLYSMGPPAYSGATRTLDYQVAAPHYKEDGTEFLGEYHLLVRNDVARCLYGLVGSNFNARIDVTAANGTPQSATTAMTRVGDWYKFSATDFTFSAPTIKAALEEVGSSGGSSTETASNPSSPQTVASPAVVVPIHFGPKVGSRVTLISPPPARLISQVGLTTTKNSVRVLIEAPTGLRSKLASYEVVITGREGRQKTLSIRVSGPGAVRAAAFKGLAAGSYRVRIIGKTSTGRSVGSWNSPAIRVG